MKDLAETACAGVCWHRKSGVGMMRIPSKLILAAGAAAVVFAGVNSSHAQQTIRVGWTIPAEEAKYWMMRRPAEFPDLGKTYNVEWRGRRQPKGLHRGTARLRKARRLFGLLGRERGFADQNYRRSQGQDCRHIRDRRRHPGTVQHAPEAERGRPDKGYQARRSRLCRFRRRAASRSRRCRQHESAVRSAGGGQGRNAQAVFAFAGDAEYRSYSGSLPRRLCRQESGTSKSLRTRYHFGDEEGASQS